MSKPLTYTQARALEIGDKVICIDPKDYSEHTVTKGTIYVIEGHDSCGDSLFTVNNGAWQFDICTPENASMFALVDESAPLTIALFEAQEQVKQLLELNTKLTKRAESAERDVEAIRIYLDSIQGFTTSDQQLMVLAICRAAGFVIDTKTTIKRKV